jgi:hypothetical protein
MAAKEEPQLMTGKCVHKAQAANLTEDASECIQDHHTPVLAAAG